MALEAAGADGSSGIPMQEIDAAEIVEKIEAGQAVEYDHVVVRGYLDLSRERLHRNITSPIRINDSIFNGQVSFNKSTLEEGFDLSGSNFTRDAYFREAEFSGYAYFGGAEFSGYADFHGAQFNQTADFWRATFSGDANFAVATFRGESHFSGATFSSDAILGATFSRRADFVGSTFEGSANFIGATFNGEATLFDQAIFSGDADFQNARFRGMALFDEATFSGDADFNKAIFKEYADFSFRDYSPFHGTYLDSHIANNRRIGATFNSKANFVGTIFVSANFNRATFNGDADFWDAIFRGDVDFKNAQFNNDIEFGWTRFENKASFYGTLFKKPAYFENSSINNLNLDRTDFSRIYLRWDSVENLFFDEGAYLALIKNYNSLGWYGDANDCYYDYRNAVRRSWQAPSSGFAARLSSLLDRLIDFVEWILYGYGVRPSFPVAWSAIIILAFGLFFRQKRCLRKIITEEKIEDAGDGSDEVLVQTKLRKAPINSIDPFVFSLFTFTSGFTAFLHPAVEYKLEGCLRWAIAERLLGPFFLALVITTISKTYLIR